PQQLAGGTQPGSGGAPAANPPASQPTTAVPSPVAAATTGRISVTRLPAGGTITVDGRPQAGPAFELAPGRHEIRLSAPGYQTATYPVSIAAGDNVEVPFTATRVLTAAPAPTPAPQPSGGVAQPPPVTQPASGGTPAGGTPAGGNTAQPPASASLGVLLVGIQGGWANVSIDNQPKGQLSTVREQLLPGTHQLKLEREGFVTIDTALTVRAGDTLRVRLRLQPRS
ncbi:MAG TPA: PEGA domain-containing protein, partial [Gemmatimonadales bacterium]|nr:PEGA domain-containing protein [Gemmatimonadales bacterium]